MFHREYHVVSVISKWKGLVTSVLSCDAVFICFRRWLLDFWINAVHIFYPEDGRNTFLWGIHFDDLRTDMESCSKESQIITEPVRLFNSQSSHSESTDARHSWDTYPADSTETPTNGHLTSLQCIAHYRSKDISEPSLLIGRAGVVWLVYCYIWGRAWFACLLQSLILLFWKPVQTPFIRRIAALSFPCHAVSRAEFVTLSPCPMDFSKSLIG